MRSMMKWEKFKILKQDQTIATHLPQTQWFNERNFWFLLGRFGTVILKPFNGYGGVGIMKVSSKNNSIYEVHHEKKITQIKKTELFPFIKKTIKSRGYLVQQWISLASVTMRPMDLRVMVQHEKKGFPWKVTGKLAKVAGKGYIVTNIKRSKGTILPVEIALQRSSAKLASISDTLTKIDQISIRTAILLSAFYPDIHMMGLDLGIDSTGKVWIIEVNFGPDISLFLHLKDKSMYRRIVWHKNKAYGKP